MNLSMKSLFTALIATLVVLTASTAGAAAITSADVESVLNRLDKELLLRDKYISDRNLRIDSIRSRLYGVEEIDSVLYYTMMLGDAFSSFNNDSTLIYYTKGYDLALKEGLERDALTFRIKRAVNLPLSGFMHDGPTEFTDIDVEDVPVDMLPFYYESGRQLCSYIASFYRAYDTGNYWTDKEHAYQSAYMALKPVHDQLYTINLASDLIAKGELSQAQGLLEDYITKIPHDSNVYARACHQLASLAAIKGDTNALQYFLAQSAMADLKSAVLEVTSLQELGVIMSESNDIDRAYNYLSAALLNSVECHASVRMLETSTSLPLIQQAHSEQIGKWRSRIYLVIVLLAVLLALMAVVLLYLRHQMHRVSMLKDRLQSANQLKDIYISQFFRLSSIYVDKMNQLCKIVNRKISSGQVDDLYKITKSNKFVEEQTQDFYRLFDDAFLHIYPNFVEQVNDLLHDKIVLKEGELLNNDLRILAFMRLGLDDTNQVAQILNYSVNTIYAYRNKLRNRAVDRDNFERNIMQIPSI